MMRWLRRLVWLGLLAGTAFAVFRMRSQRQAQGVSAPEWPPLSPEPQAAPAEKNRAAAAPAQRWVPPVDGKCPDGYPLKANDNSGIFHVPGGRFYDRTIAERCYADADDAIADGYRPAKA
ncbi:MAG: hypothetical protein QOH53_1393 [Ilumatobacteraceae bacterium]